MIPYAYFMRGMAFVLSARCAMRHVSSVTVVLVLWFAGVCAAAQFAKVGLTLPELGAIYPQSKPYLGFLVSSISFVGAFLGLFAGALAAQIGLRKLLLAGLLLGAVVSLLQATGLPLPLFLVSRLVEGLSHLAIVVAAPTLIAFNSDTRIRPAAMSLWASFFGVSFALTAWLGLPLVASQGVNTLFFIHGILMVIVTILAKVVIPENADQAVENRNTLFIPSTLLNRHKEAWSSPFVSAPAVGWLLYTLTFVALLSILPGLMPPDERGLTATALPLVCILSSLSLGILLLRLVSAVLVIQIGFIAAILAAISIALAPETLFPAIALFAALGLVQGASFAAIPQLNHSSSQQALANGALAQAGNTGNALGTPLLLAIQAQGGLTAIIAVVVSCYVIAIVAHCVLARRRESKLSCN